MFQRRTASTTTTSSTVAASADGNHIIKEAKTVVTANPQDNGGIVILNGNNSNGVVSLSPSSASPSGSPRRKRRPRRFSIWQLCASRRRLGKQQPRHNPPLIALGVASALFLLFCLGDLAWRSSPAGGGGRRMVMENNINNNNNNGKFELYTEQAPECRELESFEEISYTLVTQLSEDRLWMMEYHCERYEVNKGHKMSIAVWTTKTLAETRRTLQEDLKCDLNHLSVHVLSPVVSLEEDDYPVNQLRNLALESVATTHIIYIDVDFWTSQSMYEILMQGTLRQELWKDPQLILVIPAFMLFRHCEEYIDCREKNLEYMPFTVKDVLWMYKHKHGHIFDPTNVGGHGSTRYKTWMSEQAKKTPGNLVNINCLISKRYEPFVVVRYCRDLPPFQPAFTGYGKNKMTWMMQVIRTGYALKQVGGVFVVHYPHLESAARVKWNEAPKQLQILDKHAKELNASTPYAVRRPKKKDGDLHLATYKRGQVDEMFYNFREWLYDEVPDRSRIHLCRDAQDDDAKLWIDRTNHTKKHKIVRSS